MWRLQELWSTEATYPWIAHFPTSTIWIAQPIRIIFIRWSPFSKTQHSGSWSWLPTEKCRPGHGIHRGSFGQWSRHRLGFGLYALDTIEFPQKPANTQNHCEVNIRSNSSGEIVASLYKSDVTLESLESLEPDPCQTCGAKAPPRFRGSSSDPWDQARWPMLLQSGLLRKLGILRSSCSCWGRCRPLGCMANSSWKPRDPIHKGIFVQCGIYSNNRRGWNRPTAKPGFLVFIMWEADSRTFSGKLLNTIQPFHDEIDMLHFCNMMMYIYIYI